MQGEKNDTTAVQTMLRCSSYPFHIDLHQPLPHAVRKCSKLYILDVQKIDTFLMWIIMGITY